MRLARGTLAAMYEAVLLTFTARRPELVRRATGAGVRGSRADVAGLGGRAGSGAAVAGIANDRWAAAGDPPCAAMSATTVTQPTTAANAASTNTPVRKRTSSSQE
jgi:hypothetical protein